MKKAKTFLLTGVVLILLSAAVPFLMMLCVPQNGSVGIIGGAGAPTYWLIVYRVLDGWPIYGFMSGGILMILSLIFFIRRKT